MTEEELFARYDRQVNQEYCFSCMRMMSPRTTTCPECGYRHGQEELPVFELQPGAYLANGRYLVGKVLKRGDFGITYVGMDLILQKKVEIQECIPTGLVDRSTGSNSIVWELGADNRASNRDSFLKEAQKMANTDMLPGVAKVLNYFYQNNTAYIVMEFIEGETLRDKLKREGAMSVDSCVLLLTPVMDALVKAHLNGMIHRDISPDNIMIDAQGDPWILDLGAAKDLDVDDMGIGLTRPYEENGFRPYERSLGGAIGPWTDVYAMCATIYYCISGELVPDAFERMRSREKLAFPVAIPAKMARVLDHGLAVEWKDRIQSMQRLKAELGEALPRKAHQDLM